MVFVFSFVHTNFLTEMKSESDIGQRREILVGLDYRVLVVHIDENGEIIPVQHYRPEHTFRE